MGLKGIGIGHGHGHGSGNGNGSVGTGTGKMTFSPWGDDDDGVVGEVDNDGVKVEEMKE